MLMEEVLFKEAWLFVSWYLRILVSSYLGIFVLIKEVVFEGAWLFVSWYLRAHDIGGI